MWPGVRRAGLPKAEPGADAGLAAPRAAPLLIWYGLIRQRPGAESEGKVGEARDRGSGSGGCQAFGDGWRSAVADRVGTDAACRIYACLGCDDECAVFWR